MSGSKGPSKEAQCIACECHGLNILHLQALPKYCDSNDPNGCGGGIYNGDCEVYRSALRIDAALRHAKAEGLREAITIIKRAVTWTPQSVLEILERLARIAELERAAQIEEGEHDDSHTSND